MGSERRSEVNEKKALISQTVKVIIGNIRVKFYGKM